MWPLGWSHWSALGAPSDGANTGSGNFWGSARSWEQGRRCCCPPWLPCLKGSLLHLCLDLSLLTQVAQNHWHTGCFSTKEVETLLNFNWYSPVVQLNNSTCPWELSLLAGNSLRCSGVRRTSSREQAWRSCASFSSLSFHRVEYVWVVHISDCQGGSLTQTEFCQELHFRL